MDSRKPRPSRVILGVLCALAALVAAFFAVRAVGVALNRRTPPGGINEEMYVELNGSEQWVSIYGEDLDNPVLFYLHGGPGSATSMFDYAVTRRWADVYTVVTWDQRACGLSAGSGGENFSCEQLVSDGIALTEFLCDYLDADKITLLGHSWGSYLGCRMALERPEYYECFIGTGICAKMSAGSPPRPQSGPKATLRVRHWSHSSTRNTQTWSTTPRATPSWSATATICSPPGGTIVSPRR